MDADRRPGSLDPLPTYPHPEDEGDTPADELPTARGPPAPPDPADGPVTWVPHTHANPSHAKFCYMCLYGRLKADDEKQIEQSSDKRGEMPSQVDLRNRGYLQPEKFERMSMDFGKENLSASWARGVLRHLTKQQEDMVLKFNTQLVRQYGEHAWLYMESEEEADYLQLNRLFTLTTSEEDHYGDMVRASQNWIESFPRFSYEALGKVDGDDIVEIVPKGYLSKWQNKQVSYEPAIDLSHKLMTGANAKFTKDLVGTLDDLVHAVMSNSTGGLPLPDLEPSKGEAIMPTPPEVSEDLIPEYDRMLPPDPVLNPIPKIGDPFPEKQLSFFAFVETDMPTFSVDLGVPENVEPLLAPLNFIHPTWGEKPQSTRSGWYVPPLLDQYLWPPLEVEDSRELQSRTVLRRGLWESELYTAGGTLVPDVFQMIDDLKCPLLLPEYAFEDMQLELKGSAEIIEEMLPIRPVKSFVRFFWQPRPLPVADVLMDLVRVDFSGANFLAVIEQRYDALREIQQEERAELERQQRIMEAKEKLEREAREEYNIKPEEEEIHEKVEREEEDETAPPPPVIAEDVEAGLHAEALAATAGAGVGLDETGGSAAAADTAAEAPEAAEAAPGAAEAAPGSAEAAPGVVEGGPATVEAAAPAPRVPTPGSGVGDIVLAATGQVPVPSQVPGLERVLAIPGLPSVPRADIVEGLHDLLAKEKQTLSVENLLMDNIFVERLAEKIVGKLGFMPSAGGGAGAAGSGAEGQAASPEHRRRDQVQSYPVPSGDLSKTKGLTGASMVTTKQPKAPILGHFSSSPRATADSLPLALQGTLGQKQYGVQMGGVADTAYKQALREGKVKEARNVNDDTEEKTRGEAYVRLLTSISARVGDGKVIRPYKGEIMDPSSKVLIRTKYNLEKPVALGEEDEFEEMDRSYEVLFSFVRHNRYEAVESMLQQDTDLLAVKDATQNSLLHLCAQNNHRRIAKLLLRFRADVDAQNDKGNTPLHYCYGYGYSALAEFLVLQGADETIRNEENLLPSDGVGGPVGATGVAKVINRARAS